MKRRFTLFVVILLASCVFAYAQTSVNGTVKDDQGQNMPGVTVKAKGTSNTVVTDLNGKYSISVAANGTLVFSFIGYANQEEAVANRSVINVALVAAVKQLNELVVVGYGTQKKGDITSSISTVGVKDVSSRPIVNTSEILAGKAAGVQVFNATGEPGGGNLSVRIRGLSSPNGTEPLYVVDGVTVSNTQGVDPNNIESISVLKDPSAAGIYGSLGATNGVVLITTKKGAKGKNVVDVNLYTGSQQVIKKLDLLNADQFNSLIHDEYTNAGQPLPTYPANYTANNDWQDLIYRNANQTGINAGFSGGNDNGTYYLGLGHLNQEGVIEGSDYQRYNFNLSLEQNIKPWLRVGTNVAYNREDGSTVNDGNNAQRGGVIMAALYTPPIVPIWVSTVGGQYQGNLDNASNPLDDIYSNENHYIKNNLLGNVHLEIQLPFKIKYRSQLGIVLNNYNNDTFINPITNQGASQVSGIGTSENYETFRYVWDNTLTYNTRINNKHNITVVGGSSSLEEKNTDSQLSGDGFPNGVTTLNAASSNKSISTYKTDWTLQSYFVRANYDFEDKYLFTASLRTDGSSRSGTNNQWGVFPAVSGAWRVSKENFLKDNSFISDFKIRADWGSVGNLSPLLYPSQTALAPTAYLFDGVPLSGYIPTNPAGNPDLKWESTKGYNVGFDLSVLHDRLTLAFDVYNKKTTDMIFPYVVSTAVGGPANTTQTNLPGYVQNKGIEISLTGRIFTGNDFNWTSTLNTAFNTNVVEGLPDADNGLGEGYIAFGGNGNATPLSIVKNGLPLGAFWGYTYAGVDPATGNPLYKTATGGTTADLDNAVQSNLGSGLPKMVLGFANSLNYKNLALDFLIDAVTGNKIYDATRVETEGMYAPGNATTAVLSRWEKPGDITNVPAAVLGGSNTLGQTTLPPSSRFIENGAFLRLKSVSLSYNIKSKFFDKYGVKLRVYVNATNLFTITNYKGYYPEVNSFNGGAQGASGSLNSASSTALGIDYGVYPATRVYTAGINTSF